MLLLVTGASGVGKSTIRGVVAPELSPEVECVELKDLAPLPMARTRRWRQQMAEIAGGSASTRHLVIHSDDPDHPVVSIDVSAMTKMTLSGALQGWMANKLQALLATQTDHPCDEGTFGPDDHEC